MKFLELPQISSFNTLMGNLSSPDGTRIQSRLEVFTCKAAGNDKKLLKQLENKFSPTDGTESEEASDANSGTPVKKLTKEHSDNCPGSPSQAIINRSNGLNVKTFYYLISTMNNMFPDYDFSEVPPEVFVKQSSLAGVINHVNTSLFNTGINRNTTSFSEFSQQMWDCMASAVGELDECEIYTYSPEGFELDDPFRERGTIWTLNLFFVSRKLKRVLIFSLRAQSEYDDLGALRSGAITPISSNA